MSYNSPIDFTSGTSYTQCSDTCKFTFKYSDSSCTVQKLTSLDQQCLYATYDAGNSSTNVVYNGISYVPFGCLIFNGSFHTYDKEKSPGELLIVHQGDGGAGAGKTLVVCISITISDTSTLSESGEIIDQIIKTVPKTQVSKSDESSSPFGVKGCTTCRKLYPKMRRITPISGTRFTPHGRMLLITWCLLKVMCARSRRPPLQIWTPLLKKITRQRQVCRSIRQAWIPLARMARHPIKFISSVNQPAMMALFFIRSR